MRECLRTARSAYIKLGDQCLKNLAEIRPSGIDAFLASLPENAEILDAGCAGGRDSETFAASGHFVTVVDMVPEFLASARTLVPSGCFIEADLLELDLPPESFDAIWAHAVLLRLDKADMAAVIVSPCSGVISRRSTKKPPGRVAVLVVVSR